jgi:MFS family permease
MSKLSFFDRENTVAPAGFNRWLVPPAALSIHLAIGQAYSFSVFNLPLSKLIGITHEAPDDWRLTTIGWIFSLAIVVLGLTSAFLGAWLEKVGPRKAMFLSAICFSAGFLVSALGVEIHQIALVYLGYGVIGGMGLGIGYISPVKTLMTWFPDRPGMATGLAIMGFGGGAMIGAPLAVDLMNHYKTATSLGVTETLFAMGVLYFVFMMLGVVTVRIPAPDWKPNLAGKSGNASSQPAETRSLTANEAIRTRQFWLLWFVLFLNVTAGIAVLSQASAMSQEMFQGRITAAAAGGFVGLLSIFNMGGRFVWSSLSDYIGRKMTFALYFLLGMALYALIPSAAKAGSIAFFVAGYAVVLSTYGGGFATIPAYLRDIFGNQQVGAIHGRLLTAWSAAGIAGPTLINYIRQYELSRGVPTADLYVLTMYIMAALLVVGLICNALVQPLPGGAKTKGAQT